MNKLILLPLFILLSSCFLQKNNFGGSLRRGVRGVRNTPDSVNVGEGRLLLKNPIASTGNFSLTSAEDLSLYLNPTPQIISNSNFLSVACDTVTPGTIPCFSARRDLNQIAPLFSSTNKWAFNVNTPEFLQVNTFGNIKNMLTKFTAQNVTTPTWFTSFSGASAELKIYADIIPVGTSGTEWANAMYDPALNALMFGQYTLNANKVYFADDNSVIFHELGHTLQHLMLNQNNMQGTSSSNNIQHAMVHMGNLFYEEAGAIGEGVSDFFSFYQNGRTHFAEWAAGLLKQSRPISENDILYSPVISSDPLSRLSYPTYINYNPNDPAVLANPDSVHLTGMVISHFLSRLVSELQQNCLENLNQATSDVTKSLINTFKYLGDFSRFINASATPDNTIRAMEMITSNLNISYQRFAREFSKNFRTDFLSQATQCYTANQYIDLLDSYGLLLFHDNGIWSVNTVVSNFESHRNKSTLISKNNLITDPAVSIPKYYVIDDRATMIDAYTKLSSLFKEQSSPKLVNARLGADQLFPYNNGNSLISPGEMTGIAFNIFNNSNVRMAGVQILANDWGHIVTPNASTIPLACNYNNFPGINAGGSNSIACSTVSISNNTSVALLTTPFDTVSVEPVCLMQTTNTINQTTEWVRQDIAMTNLGFSAADCLNPTNPHECFARFMRGKDRAYIPYIEPQKSWTQQSLGTIGTPTFQYHNLLFLETNTNVPVGTKFSCRLRVNFSNCSDCFDDGVGNDYSDYDYSISKPFKVFNFDFTVSP